LRVKCNAVTEYCSCMCCVELLLYSAVSVAPPPGLAHGLVRPGDVLICIADEWHQPTELFVVSAVSDDKIRDTQYVTGDIFSFFGFGQRIIIIAIIRPLYGHCELRWSARDKGAETSLVFLSTVEMKQKKYNV
jgi:hypothetical protein